MKIIQSNGRDPMEVADRVFGYGLKYADSSDHTHLGWVGKTGREMAAKGAELPASGES